MSYRRPHTENLGTDYQIRLKDFRLLAPKLLQADNPLSFEIWLDKLICISSFDLILFLRLNQTDVPKSHLKQAEARLFCQIKQPCNVTDAPISKQNNKA